MKTLHYTLIAATACLALAACGKKESTTITTSANGSTTVETSTGAQPMSAASLGIKPGKWQTTIQVTDLKMSGPAVAGMPAMPKPAPVTMTMCMTPEQASKGPGELLKNAKADCTATRNVYSGGKLDVAMTCKMPGGDTMSTKTSGTYSPTEMTTDAEVEMTGRMSMSQKVHTEAKRIGDCTS
jgi:hypothetical protein